MKKIYCNKATNKAHSHEHGSDFALPAAAEKNQVVYKGATQAEALAKAKADGFVGCKHCWDE